MRPITRIGRRGAAGAEALRRRRRLKEAAVLVALLVVIALFYVWSRIAVVQTGYRLHHLVSEYEAMEDKYRALKLEWATRTSPDRLQGLGQSRFGLQVPQPGQFVVLPHPMRLAVQRERHDEGE